MEKQCKKCKLIKSIDDFNKKGNGYSYFCKECNREYLKEHYNNNKEYYAVKRRKYQKSHRDWFIGIKQKLKCENCNDDRWWVLDFHHIDSMDKDDDIARMMASGKAKKIILAEIEKCKILCANCHRDLHYRENN